MRRRARIAKEPDDFGYDKVAVAEWLKTLPLCGPPGCVASTVGRGEVYGRRFYAMGIEGADLEGLDHDTLAEELGVQLEQDRVVLLAEIQAGSWRK